MPPRPRFASRPVPGPTGPTTLFHITHERHVRMVEVLGRTTTEVAIDLREVEEVTVIDLRPHLADDGLGSDGLLTADDPDTEPGTEPEGDPGGDPGWDGGGAA